MNYGLKRYNQSTAQSMTPRQVEAMAFAQSIEMLRAAKNQKDRLHALSLNQKLWSAVLREVALEDNGFPEILKKDLLNLANWATKYSVRAMLHDISLKPLIDVNQDMLDGLRAKVETAPAAVPAQFAQSVG